MGKKGLSLIAEAGILMQGDPEVTLEVQAPASAGVTQDDVDAERQQMQDDLDSLKNWPVISLGLIYQY